MTKIAVAGAGLIGRRHVDVIRQANDIWLAAIVDPTDAGRDYAASLSVPWYPSLKEMFAETKPDGVVLATPNQVHVSNGLDCVEENCPMLVEKPISVTGEEGQILIDRAKENGTPVLVGHHRRHNPIIQLAQKIIREGKLGQLTTVQGTCLLSKPDEYYAPEWRRKAGAGPVMVNAIHDIDLLRYMCGDVTSVTAISSSNVRGFETEDTAVAILQFANGVLGNVTISDATASPWSWEMTSGENYEFPETGQTCYTVGGTKGSLSVPDLKLWQHEDGGYWKDPIKSTSFPRDHYDPLMTQIKHFADVINGKAEPIVSGEEGLKSLQVVEAVLQSASTGETIHLS